MAHIGLVFRVTIFSVTTIMTIISMFLVVATLNPKPFVVVIVRFGVLGSGLRVWEDQEGVGQHKR